VPEVRVDRAQAQSRIDIDRHALAALAGEGATAYEQITRPHLTNDEGLGIPEVLPADLLLRRPDVAAALARVDAQGANEEAARLAAYPDIDLRGIGGLAALSVPDLLTHPARVIAVGPTLRLPIFDSGRIRALHRVANADFELAVADYNATVIEAVREVADQLTALAAVEAVVRDQQRNLELLTQAQHLAEERYQAGLSTRQPVLETEGRILTVKSALVSSSATAAEVRVDLLVAIGGSTEPVINSKAAP
jgi:outer membrane protein TolC